MTNNQIRYAELVEKRRSNLANESLTRSRDKATREHYERSDERELAVLGETIRSNKAKEAQNAANLAESVRSNLRNEEIKYGQLSETVRSNISSESIRSTANAISSYLAEEQMRSNLAREAETHRSNVASEQTARLNSLENVRSNMVGESLSGARLGEDRRSNIAKETETNRSNIARETETNRSNLARETETNRSNLARERETERSNLAKESETVRHNKATDLQGAIRTATDVFSSLATGKKLIGKIAGKVLMY